MNGNGFWNTQMLCTFISCLLSLNAQKIHLKAANIEKFDVSHNYWDIIDSQFNIGISFLLRHLQFWCTALVCAPPRPSCMIDNQHCIGANISADHVLQSYSLWMLNTIIGIKRFQRINCHMFWQNINFSKNLIRF